MLGTSTRDRLRSRRSQPHGTGASLDDVSKAESILGVKFPASYLDFLVEIGWGGIGHLEFYGVGSGVPAYLDLVQVTTDERNRYTPLMPAYLVPILNDGAGNHYCLDTRELVAGECRVVFWNHELDENQLPSEESESFETWLMHKLDELI